MKPLTYAAAGVNIARGEALVDYIKTLVRRSPAGGLVSGVGGFGAVTRVPVRRGRAGHPRVPLLVSGTDGVGTKLKVAFLLDKHDTVGIDLVAMSVNDVVVQGAAPAFFLDYLAMGKLDLRVAKALIRGIVEGCRRAGCALIGGETAELSGLYRDGEYDLAGFCVGTVPEKELIDGKGIRPGDAVIGIGSMGLHSNGYTLAFKVLLERKKLPLRREVPELGCPLGEELLRPTRIYVRTVQRLRRAVPVLGLAHITGGGLPGNALRPLPRGLGLRLARGTWPVLPVFSLIQRLGRVREAEMLRTFNMGLGMIAIVRRSRVDEALQRLLDGGDRAHVVGEVTRSGRFELV